MKQKEKAYSLDFDCKSSNTVVGITIWENEYGNYNHNFYITSKNRVLDRCSEDYESLKEMGIFFFQSIQSNVPIFSAICQHFREMEQDYFISKGSVHFFFANNAMFNNFLDWTLDHIVPRFKLTDYYNELDSIADMRLNMYLNSILTYTDSEKPPEFHFKK